MNFNLKKFKKKAKLIRKSSRYSVYDLILDNLVSSITILHPQKETKGHSHPQAEEIYLCLEGKGIIQLNKKKSKIAAGDFIHIKKGTFHKVFNPENKDFIFLSIFEKYKGRGKK